MRSTNSLGLTILFIVAATLGSFGQVQNIIPPTPNAMKMTEYHAQRPNMYTGTANVSIPLYTIDFDGWKLPLSISYNATGIRTNEEASEVGLGWALNATGLISRTIKDSDDLLKGINSERKGYVYNDKPVPPAGSDLGYHWQTMPTPPEGSYYKWMADTRPDTQPDIFTFNFFGHSGSFLLSQKISTGNVVTVKKITQDASLIAFDETLGTFTITTPDGYKGEFTIKERSTSFAGSTVSTDRMSCCSQGLIDITQTQNNGRYRVPSTWYLSRITSPRGQVIDFNYDLNVDGSSPYLSNSRAFAELPGITSPQTCLQTVQEHVYLKSIVSEEVRVDFQMEIREDLKKNDLYNTGGYFAAGQPLKRFIGMTIKGIDAASTLNKTITFVQRYFNPQYHNRNPYLETENEVRWMRSRLDRLIIDDQEYRFYYDNGANGLPDKLTTGIDHFGFYNGQDNTQSLNPQVLPPDPVAAAFAGSPTNMSDTSTVTVYYKQKWERRVVFSNGKAGLLTKVKYPTRGYSIFEYEPHTYLPDQTGAFIEQNDPTQTGENLAGGARIKSIKEYDYNDNLTLSKSYKYLENAAALNAGQSPATGKLMTPLYNRYAKRIYTNYTITSVTYLYKSHSTIPGNNSAEGKIIGYSRVHEIVTGPGTETYRNTYYFENRPSKLTWNIIKFSYPYLNGQLIESRNYDSQGKIVQQVKNLNYNHRLDSVQAIVYDFPSQIGGYYDAAVRYSIPLTFNTPYSIVTTTSETPSSIVEAADGSITSYGKVLQFQKDLVYNTTGTSPSFLLRSQQITASNGDIVKVEFKRPLDYPSPAADITYMIGKNMIEPLIEEITTRNGVVISANGNYYEREMPAGPRVNLIATYSYNRALGTYSGPTNGQSFVSPYEKKSDIKYDGVTGKIKEYTGQDGITNSLIWGYNNKIPIVHGMGITYDQLSIAYNASVGNPNYETLIRTHANTQGGQVTTYIHNPLVGITTATNPAQLKKTYQYDSYARLSKTLDNSGNTLDQYQYHFKELPITRNFSVLETSIAFGSFYACKMPAAKTLTLTNSGEDDLNVSTFSVPTGFTSDWSGGIIAAGTSIVVGLTFTGATGNYASSISITSNRTDGPATVTIPITANYIASGTTRTIAIAPPAPLIFDSQFQSKTVSISNTGNDCLDVTGISVSDTQNWSVSINTALLMPGESTTMTIVRLAATPAYGGTFPTATVTVTSNKNAGTNTLQVALPTRVISLSTSAFPSFTGPSATQSVTVTNNGNSPLSITGVSSSNGMFTVSPTTLSNITPGGSQNVTVTFTPTAYNFSLQSATLTFSGDQNSGVNTIGVSAQRTETRIIQLSPSSLVFDYTGQSQTVTVSNTGNNYLNVTGVTYPSTSNWNSWITAANLAPGQSTNLTVVRTGASPEAISFTVTSNKLSGNNVVPATANTRTIGISNTAFPSFTNATYTQNMTVTNTGNATLTVSNITSSNSKFSISPTSFTVGAGLQQTVAVTYTPTDFTAQSTSLVFYSDATNYSGSTTVATSAQRAQLYQVDVSPLSVVIKPSQQTQTVTITNNGNINAAINSVGNSNSAAFALTYWMYTGGVWVQFTSLPYTLAPGTQMQVKVTTATSGVFSSASGTMTITPNQGSSTTVNMARAPM